MGLPDRLLYNESDLENGLMNNLSQFLLELGKGFAFIGKQYRFSVWQDVIIMWIWSFIMSF